MFTLNQIGGIVSERAYIAYTQMIYIYSEAANILYLNRYKTVVI